MLTTAGPCFSTSSVKSGNWAAPASGTASRNMRRTRLNMSMLVKRSVVEYRFIPTAPASSARRSPEFERVGDLHHRRRRRLAQHGHHMVGDAPHIDVDRALVRQA